MTDLDLLKLKYQHELDTHLVLAVNDDFFCYIKLTNSESKKKLTWSLSAQALTLKN
jgi:hypothetical protein